MRFYPLLVHASFSSHVVLSTAEASPGYTLVTVTNQSTIYLLDLQGQVAHSWNMPFDKVWPNRKNDSASDELSACMHFTNAFLYPNGDVMGIYHSDTHCNIKYHSYSGFGLIKMDKNSNLLWKSEPHIHHYLSLGDDGRIYTLGEEHAPFSSARWTSENNRLFLDSIEVLSPLGKQLDKISVLEAFLGTPYEKLLFEGRLKLTKDDATHANSVVALSKNFAPQFPKFRSGQVLVSLRNQSTIAVIDPKSKKVVWAQKGPWVGQHDAQFLPNGHIVLFDNLGADLGQKRRSRILELDPKNGTIETLYAAPEGSYFFSAVKGGEQLLPNGNMLITESVSRRTFEINQQKKRVWELELDQNDVYLESATRIPFNGVEFLK